MFNEPSFNPTYPNPNFESAQGRQEEMQSAQIFNQRRKPTNCTHQKKQLTYIEQLEHRIVFSGTSSNLFAGADLLLETELDGTFETTTFADVANNPIRLNLKTDKSTDADGADESPASTSDVEILSDLVFTPDPGIRVEGATIPEVGIDPESGTVYLYHSVGPESFVALSDDGGLNFSDPQTATDHAFDTRGLLMPQAAGNGQPIWRQYKWEQGIFASAASYDGLQYTRENGVRYDPPNTEIVGVYTNFATADGRVGMMYIGDKGTSEASVRLAYSVDNGETFKLYDENPLNDLGTHDDGLNQRDPAANVLSDGRVRIFTMVQGGPQAPMPGQRSVGEIYSFTSSDDGLTFSKDTGVRLAPTDFTEFDVWSLNDPSVIELADGRYRMYVAALITETSDATSPRWVIVSATTSLEDSTPQPTDGNPKEVTVQQLDDGSFICRPVGEGPFPAVLYNHGGLGTAVGGDLLGTCKALAEAGYLARSEQRPPSVSLDGQLDDVLQGLDALRSHSDVDPERVSVMGFSRGGLLALQAAIARPDDVDAVLLFAPAPGRGAMEETLQNVSAVQAPVRIYIAENDSLLPLAQEVSAALQDSGKNVELTVYPAFEDDGHDLFFEVRDLYWNNVLDFLGHTFESSTNNYQFVLNEAILGQSDVDNTLKGMNVVSDGERGLAYVTGIMTDAVSVVNLETGTLERTFYLTDHPQATKKLAFDPVHRQLWAIANKQDAYLWLADPDTGSVLASRDISEDLSDRANSYPIRDVAVDPQRQLLYTLISDVHEQRVAVYDTSLQVVDELLVGRAIVDLEWDVERRTLIALSSPTPESGQPAQILLLPQGSETEIQSITPDIAAQSATRPPSVVAVDKSGDLFLVGQDDLWRINDVDGSVIWHTQLSFQATNLAVSGDQVGVLHQYGATASHDVFVSRLSTYGTESGELLTVRNGRFEASRMDSITGGFLVGNGGDASVSIFLADETERTDIQVGSAAEDVLVTPDGSRMLVLNRLGGSQLIEYHLETGASRVLDTVPWPVRMVQRSEDGRLFIFSHFAPTVEVRDLETLEILNQISLAPYGVVASYSDTLSDMAADPNGDLLVALQCEQGKVAIIDGATESVLAVVDLGGMRPNDGPGRMNATVDLSDPDNRRVFVFLADDNTLYRLEESNGFVPRVEDTVEVAVDHHVQKTYGFRSVYYSPAIDKIFVWNVTVDPDTLSVEADVEGVERFVGEAAGVLYAQHQVPAKVNRTESLVTVDNSTFEIVHQQLLTETMAMDAKVYLDMQHERVAFTRSAYSEVHLVGIEPSAVTEVQIDHLSTKQMPVGTHRPEILATESGEMLAVVVQPDDDAMGNRIKHQVYHYDADGNQFGEPFPVTWVTEEYGEPADHRAAVVNGELVVVYQSLVFDENPGIGGGPAEQYALNQSLLLARYSLDGQELFRGPIVAHVTDFSEDSFPDHCLLPLKHSLLVSTGADNRVKIREVSYSGEVLNAYEFDTEEMRSLSSIGNSLLRHGDQVWMITGTGKNPHHSKGISVLELDAEYQPTELAWFTTEGQEYTFPTGTLLYNGYTFVTYDARETTERYLSPDEHPFQPSLMVLDSDLNVVMDMPIGSGPGFAHIHPTLDIVGDELVIGWSMKAEVEGANHQPPQVQLERYSLTFVEGGTAQLALWDGDGPVGDSGDGIHWDDPNNWTIGGSVDVLPSTSESSGDVVFQRAPTVGSVLLGADRTVNSLTIQDDYTLTGHTLTVTNGLITVKDDTTATIAARLAGNSGLEKSGTGTLVVTNTAPDLVVDQGTLRLSSTGSVQNLTIEADATAILNGSVQGNLVNNGLLSIGGDAVIDATEIEMLYSNLSDDVPGVHQSFDWVGDELVGVKDVHALAYGTMGNEENETDLEDDVDIDDRNAGEKSVDASGQRAGSDTVPVNFRDNGEDKFPGHQPLDGDSRLKDYRRATQHGSDQAGAGLVGPAATEIQSNEGGILAGSKWNAARRPRNNRSLSDQPTRLFTTHPETVDRAASSAAGQLKEASSSEGVLDAESMDRLLRRRITQRERTISPKIVERSTGGF